MKRLRKGGGTASLAVHRAEEIIKGLSVRERRMIEDSSRRLKYGDLRIEYGLKYNLGRTSKTYTSVGWLLPLTALLILYSFICNNRLK